MSGDIADFSLPVSITEFRGSKFLVANYSDVYLFDRETGRLDKLQFEPGEYSGKFVPTDTSVDPADGSVFVANYTANNLLRARIDIDRLTLGVTDVVGDKDSLSPEGVSVTRRWVAAANYDGNNVQFFDRMKPAGPASCRIEAKYAHGVQMIGDYGFATSLGTKEVLKIDPVACRVVARTGGAGWQDGQFLWPTSVAALGDDKIAISDAHTGRITVLNQNLEFQYAFGGNGPGNLNMPYGVEFAGGKIFITSTYANAIATYSEGGTKASEYARRQAWAAGNQFDAYTLNSEKRTGYVNRLKNFTIAGKCYMDAYGELNACDDAERMRLPPVGGSYFYFTQTLISGNNAIVVSPQSTFALVFDRETGARREVEIGYDHWVVGDKVVGPEGDLDINAPPKTHDIGVLERAGIEPAKGRQNNRN